MADVIVGVPVVAPQRGHASVVVDRAARPDRATHVSLETFDGPLALLLALIEQRQLDVLEVPLGDLAGAYLDSLASLGEDQLPHLSTFIAVCSQLILIKSRALLPRPPPAPVDALDEGHDPEADLRARLLLYRRYRDAGARLWARVEAGMVLVHREPMIAAAAGDAGARPPSGEPLDATLLVEAMSTSLRLAPPVAPPAGVMSRTVTLAERAAVIRRAILRAPAVVLQELLSDVRDRVVVAVTFMAMLELVKARELAIEQAEPWGPIVCRAVKREGPNG